ncbi:MAG: HDOD domain-containing protein [Rhodocyclaceae bacterium]|nr:HDOD domain-containing protein [Rhodocyclaceae bacterium]
MNPGMPLVSVDIRDRLLAARLPAMPQVLLKLLELCRSDNASIGDFAGIVAMDAGMSGRVMGVAHSAAFARSGKRLSLEQALLTLGLETLKTLVIGESVSQVFNRLSQQCPADISGFWRHSLTTAVLARELAQGIAYPHAEEAYLAGLLHNVGRLALAGACPREYLPFFRAADTDATCALERSTLAITHAEAGAWLVERWHLDSFLSDSVLYHHEAASALRTAAPLIQLTHLAHRIAEHGADSDESREAAELYRIAQPLLQTVAARADELVTAAAAQLGIDLGTLAAEEGSDGANGSHARLAEQVRQMVLATEATRPLLVQRSDQAVLQAMLRAAGILFGIEDGVALLHDGRENVLVGVPLDKERQRLAQMSLPMHRGTQIVEAALSGKPQFIAHDAACSIAERQLLRMLGTDTAICLPLPGAPHPIGVLVCTARTSSEALLREHVALLQDFAHQGAQALQATRRQREETSTAIDELVDEYGDAARRMVHEASNPLAIIKNYMSILHAKLDSQSIVSSELSILNEELDRVGRILDSFAHRRASIPDGLADLNRAARDVVRLFEETGFAAGNITMTVHAGDALLNVPGDPNALRQILINLVKNAVEAMPAGGELRVSTRGPVNFGGQLFAEVGVQDTGPGMPEATLGQIFGPIKSSKGEGHRGLGLCIVNELVEKLGGKVICCSSREGTSFTVLLPVERRAACTEDA